MRDRVQKQLDEGGTLDDAYLIDQVAFQEWYTYEELHKLNAGRFLTQMEVE